jgi:hypothetical protein
VADRLDVKVARLGTGRELDAHVGDHHRLGILALSSGSFLFREEGNQDVLGRLLHVDVATNHHVV